MARYEMTTTPIRQDEIMPAAADEDRAGIFDEIMEGMRTQLPGSGWEPISHAIANVDARLILSVLWRAPD